MSILRRRWPAVQQFWFDDPIPATGIDVAYYYQRSQPIAGSTSGTYHTLLIDLTQDETAIESGFTKETRYELRRAEKKDQFECRSPFDPDEAAIRAFHSFFISFCSRKNLGGVDLEYLLSAQAGGHLRLSAISHQSHILVWHSYLWTTKRVRLLHSASLLDDGDSTQRALVGRANRLLHWVDMRTFKSEGIDTYDFGGWFHGRDENGQPRENKFKSSFGGYRKTEYDGVTTCSQVGKLYMRLRSLKSKIKIV